MKPWIRRSLFGLFGSALVAGSIAGCAGHHHHGWHDADADEHRARIVERIGSKLELDASQKGKLEVLARRLHAQRMAMRGETDPRAEFRALIAGNKLDQQRAAQLVEEKTAAIRAGSPAVIAAAADFFDNLDPEQQRKVREFMERGRRWGRPG